MAEPAPTLAAGPIAAAGSVGTVETQYADLPEPVRLDCGRELHPIRVAYETYGALAPQRDNVIVVCHALSGDAHAAGFAKTPPDESTRDGFADEDRDGMAGGAFTLSPSRTWCGASLRYWTHSGSSGWRRWRGGRSPRYRRSSGRYCSP